MSLFSPVGVEERSIAVSWLRARLPVVALLAAVMVVGLIVALALGWNSPRPLGAPDWEAADLPHRMAVAPDTTSLKLLGHPSGDFTLEVTVLPLTEPGRDFYNFGLVYRAQDRSHYYAFALGTDGYYAVLRVDGDRVEPLIPWQQFPHIRRGQQQNRLLAACSGAACTFRINDEYAATIEDDRWLSGDVGLWGQSAAKRVMLEFKDARTWALDR